MSLTHSMRYFVKFALLYVVVVLGILTPLYYALNEVQNQRIEDILLENQILLLEEKISGIQSHVDDNLAIVQFIKNYIEKSDFIHQVQNNLPLDSEELDDEKEFFDALIKDEYNIVQIRLIDYDGKEIFSSIVQNDESFFELDLENQSGKEWLQRSLEIKPDDFFISKIEPRLSSEGVPLEPLQIVYRVITPVNFEDGDRVLLVVSFDSKYLLSKEKLSIGNLILVGTDGNLLVSNLESDSEYLSQNYFYNKPVLKSNIEKFDKLIYNDDVLSENRVWEKFYLHEDSEYQYILLYFVPAKVLADYVSEVNYLNKEIGILITVVIALSLILVSYFISRNLRNTIEKIKNSFETFSLDAPFLPLTPQGETETRSLIESTNKTLSSIQTYEQESIESKKEIERQLTLVKNYNQIVDKGTIVTVTDTNGVITYVNDQFSNVSKYPKDEIIGKTYAVLKSGFHTPEFYKDVWETISKGKIWIGIFKNKSKYGDTYWLKSTIMPFYDPAGTIESYMSISVDISEERSLQERLDESLRDRISANAKMTQFLGMATHELKTPLVPILGYCEMLLESANLSKEQKMMLKNIMESGNELASLINDLIDANAIEKEALQVNKTNTSAKALLTSVYEESLIFVEGVKFRMEIKDADDCPLNTDVLRVKQVFRNLIKNSLDFLGKDPEITIGAFKENNSMVFYVKDNGVGISQDVVAKLFTKFYQVDTSITRKHGGLGLGLMICKGIVTSLGGRIWVDSGKETVFYFTIPIENNSK